MKSLKIKDIQNFLKFEKQNNFDEIVYGNRKVWPIIRYAVFYYLKSDKHYSYEYHNKKKNINLKKIKFAIFNSLSILKIFGRCDVLIYDYGRHQKIGKQIINPLKFSLSKSVPKKLNTFFVTKNNEYRYKDQLNFYLIYKIIFIIYKLIYSVMGNTNIEKELNNKIYKSYQKKINIKSIIFDVLIHQLTIGIIFDIIFVLKKPKIILYSDNAEMSDIIFRAKKRNIVTVDLQHSIISKLNILYQHNKNVNKEYLSDFVLTYGDYWNKFLSDNYKKIAIGNYINEYYSKKNLHLKKSENNITIISSIVSRKYLTDLAIFLSNKLPKRKIIYKLRPEEYSNWKDVFPDKLLKQKNIVFVDNEKEELYKILNNSSFVIGTNSTVLIQSLPFAKVIIIKTGLYDEMEELIRDGYVKLVNGKNDLLNFITRNKTKNKKSYKDLFKSNFSNNIKKFFIALDL